MAFNESMPPRIPTPYPSYNDSTVYLKAEINKLRHEIFEHLYQIHRRLESLEVLVQLAEDDGK